MRVLFATVPADGHFNPLTAVAVDLLAGGHDVRWYAGPWYEHKLAALGIPSVPYRRATEVRGDNIDELHPERATLKGPKLIAFDAEKMFVANVESYYEDLVAVHAEFPFDLFVCDTGFYALKLVAERLGVPVYSFSPGPLMTGPGVPPPFFGLRPTRSVVGKAVHRVVRAMVHSTLRPGLATYNAVLAGYGIAPVAVEEFFAVATSCSKRVFLVGSHGLDFPQLVVPANAEFVGPLLGARTRSGGDAALPDVIRDARSTVVAVSQGTVDNADPTKLIIPTLAALHTQPVVVVVTTGGKNTAELRRRFPQSNVVIEDFLDYDELFDHVDVFVTNGGAGSVLSAMAHGVPVVTAGKREAKNDINARIAYNRLGVDLRTEKPKERQIASAVQRVIDDATIAAAVDRVRDELASYDPLPIIRGRLEMDHQRAP